MSGQHQTPTGHRVLYWVHDTARLPFETGIQRVVRHLSQGLTDGGTEVVPVGWDWRTRTVTVLRAGKPSNGGKIEDFGDKADAGLWLLIPEISLDLAVHDIDPVQIGKAYGFKTAAWVHDLIPLKFSQCYDDPTLAHFRRYYAMFAAADVVFASTNYVANDLREHLRLAGARIPEIIVIPFAAQFAHRPRQVEKAFVRSPGDPLKFLAVSTWEPRKNYPRLLKAIRKAKLTLGLSIELTLVGQRGHFPDYDAEVKSLLADMPNVVCRGSISDDELVALYGNCHASVYPSYEEGFGLPIVESLWLATPCLCHGGSSMAEIAPGGGVLTVNMTDEDAIVLTLRSLGNGTEVLARLSAEIVERVLVSWDDYASAIAQELQL